MAELVLGDPCPGVPVRAECDVGHGLAAAASLYVASSWWKYWFIRPSTGPAGARWPGDIVHDVVVGDVGLVLVIRDGGLLLAGVPQVSRFDHGEVARCQEWQLS